MEEDVVDTPRAANAIEEREIENVKLDIKHILIKATLPVSDTADSDHRDPEKVDPKFYKVRGRREKLRIFPNAQRRENYGGDFGLLMRYL